MAFRKKRRYALERRSQSQSRRCEPKRQLDRVRQNKNYAAQWWTLDWNEWIDVRHGMNTSGMSKYGLSFQFFLKLKGRLFSLERFFIFFVAVLECFCWGVHVLKLYFFLNLQIAKYFVISNICPIFDRYYCKLVFILLNLLFPLSCFSQSTAETCRIRFSLWNTSFKCCSFRCFIL